MLLWTFSGMDNRDSKISGRTKCQICFYFDVTGYDCKEKGGSVDANCRLGG